MGTSGRRVLTAVALGALAGCNAILGIGDVHSSASSADAALPTVDAPPNTVTGTSVITYVKSDGMTETRDEDLTAYRIRAWLPDSSASGYQIVDGVGTQDGTFTIQGVPDGMTYLLELSRAVDTAPTLFATDQHVIDAGFVTIGRPDAVSATLTTPLTMTITGMTPWASGDSLWADSFSTGTENAVFPNATLTNRPTAGATALTNASVDWKSGYTYDFVGAPPRLVQKSVGDDLYLFHQSTDKSRDGQGFAVDLNRTVDVFQAAPAPEMTDGGSASIAGAFTHVPLDKHQAFRLDLPQYRALAGDGNRFGVESYNCYRLTNYAIAYNGRIGSAIWGISGTLSPQQTTVTVSASPWGDPFGGMWSSLIGCDYAHTRYFRMPNNKVVVWNSSLGGDGPATDDIIKTPLVGAPTNATIGGKPFLDGGTVPFDGTAPVVVTWSPTPNVTHHRVIVRHLYVNGTKIAAEITATIDTSGTRVSIPASALVKGDFYNLQLQSIYHSDKTTYPSGHLRRFGFPSGVASVFSGLYRFSSDCGNHTTDAGETCDDGGESATCDTDCSARSCGDGLINVTAGEACDDVFDSPTCDGDCTLATCGDGYMNLVAGEQCDDGNTVNGDGCSSTCKDELCGNSVVENVEDCDDGNALNGDGCSAGCHAEDGWICDASFTPTKCTRQ